MVIGLWILIGVVVIFGIMIIANYNRFQILKNRIDNSLSQINVQLKRRADLIPNLIKTVKGYAKHEKDIMKEVSEARKSLVNAKNVSGKVKADKQLEGALGRLFAVAENYPDLKANQNFLNLQNELTSTEDKVAYSRQFYNDTVLNFNNKCETFPGNIFAKMFGFDKKEYIAIEESEKKKPEVNF